HVRDALPDLRSSAMNLGRQLAVRAAMQPHARRRVIVKPLGIADVLETDGETDAAPNTFAARRVPGAARKPQRIARQLLGLGQAQRSAPADYLRDGERAADHL